MQADACADRHTDACADVYSDALADRHTDACADVDVRACLHAAYHARCGLTGTHAQACTMAHTHPGTCARARRRTQAWALTHKCGRAVHICAGAALGLRRYWCTSPSAGTEADLRCD